MKNRKRNSSDDTMILVAFLTGFVFFPYVLGCAVIVQMLYAILGY